MSVYLMLTTLTDQGRKDIQEDPEILREINREVEIMGVKILDQYALLGQYDFVNILEAPSNEAVAKLAIRLEKYEEAAKLFEKAQMPMQAASVYEKLNNPKMACQLRGEDALARGKMGTAAEWFKKGEDYIRAAEFFEWEKEFEKAAYCYFMNQNYLASADNYLKAGKEEEAARMFELGREWKQSADISLKYKKYQKVVRLSQKYPKKFKLNPL